VTRIIDRLEEKGLLRRLDSGSDRRSRPVVLTAAGENLLLRIDECWVTETPHTSQLSQEEAATLNALLDRLREV
jgi:DNA-binding MarR family transcriptional regulator